VIPQVIHDTQKDVALFMRVTQPFGKVRFTVSDGETVLATARRQKAAPGEMEKITVKAEMLKKAKGNITVSLEVVE
jgi:hypothetical protein